MDTLFTLHVDSYWHFLNPRRHFLVTRVYFNREELERQQNELRALLEKLEKDREMEAEERQKLEEEVR